MAPRGGPRGAGGSDADAKAPVLVCGGAVVDCIVKPSDPSQRGASRTSLPGEARVSSGGVARNIAEALARLGGRPRLLSAVGRDEAGARLREASAALGIDVVGIAEVQGQRTATFTALLDGAGDLVGAVADMAVFDAISPSSVEDAAAAGAFKDIALVVCDGNLSPKVLDHVCVRSAGAGVPAWFEPVSVAKAPRGLGGRWHLVSPNWDELCAMLGRPPAPEPRAPQAAAAPLPDEVLRAVDDAMSVGLAQHLLLTMGPGGALLASAERDGGEALGRSLVEGRRFDIDVAAILAATASASASSSAPAAAVPPLSVSVERLDAGPGRGRRLLFRLLRPLDHLVDSTGAGDSLVAGTARAFSAGWPLDEAVLAGLVCAHITLLTQGAVAPSLSAELLPRLRASLAAASASAPSSRL